MAIVKVLATIRAKEANLRHRKCFYWQYFRDGEDPGGLRYSDAALLLPPRRAWARPPKKHRNSSRRPIVETLRDSIIRKVQGVYYAGRLAEYEWGKRLLSFVNQMQERVAKSDFAFHKPKLWLRPKAVPLGGRPKYRCISFYDDLSDRVLLSLANKYLSSMLDGQLSEDSYAFRTSKRRTHITAIKKIVALRKANKGRLYVADCDLLKFFDVVNHEVVRKALRRKCIGSGVDAKMFGLVDGFLASYSQQYVAEFKHFAVNGNWKAYEGVDMRGLSTLYGGTVVKMDSIGLPQGGALSGLLANIVLDDVDRAVANVSGVFYARYCDDMIFISETKRLCEEALSAALLKLGDLKIPVHKVKHKVRYEAKYYEVKSKGPYAWGNPREFVAVVIPWVSFLGYCIRFDGSVRARKETVMGHAQSLREECEFFWNEFRRYGLRNLTSKVDAVSSLFFRLVGKGVGQISVNPGKCLGRCWLSAYKFIGESLWGMRQMRYLDRVRSMEFASVKKRMNLQASGVDGENGEVSLYFGKPFSYAGTAERLSRKGIMLNRKLLLEERDGKHLVSQDEDLYCDDGADYDDDFTSGWERASGR